MAIAYSTAAANARLTQTYNATGTAAGVSVNGQTAGGGLLVIGTSGLSGATGVLATVTLTSTPPGVVASKVWTLSGTPLSATPSANGTAALAELRDSAGNTVASGLTVGTSGASIIVTTTTFSTGIPVSVTSGTITSP
jgi:hypothetical protein